jgi:GH15 family glucan-1,4-alpha-glucosidase
MTPDDYPPIGSLTAIGDGYSLALLGPDAAVEWWCPLRFDASPIVWPLLDRRRGGRFRIGPVDAGAADEVAYEPGTAVATHTWHLDTGSLRLTSAMAWPQPRSGQQLLFHAEAVSGEVKVETVVDLQADWGRLATGLSTTEDGADLTAGDVRLHLETPAPPDVRDGVARTTTRLRAGETATIRVAAADGRFPRVDAGAAGLLAATRAAWHDWTSGIAYDGPCPQDVLRSAITLKLLIYEPTGAVVAAGTTSLPQEIGGVRNWDDRYTWLRDAGFTLNSLYALGCRREAHAYAQWLTDVVADAELPLNVLYGIDGGSGLAEATVDHADGYRRSRPVRVGNAAEGQLQLDTYGELLDCITICEVMDDHTLREGWPHFRRLVDFVADHWDEPDSGIWEVRDQPRHFVHSKAHAWVALDRGARLTGTFDLDGDADRWRQEADLLRAQVEQHGVAPGGWFTRSYGDTDVDASLLTLPTLGYVDGTDPRMLATIDAAYDQLSVDGAIHPGMLLRYPHHAGDGLPGAEGAFALCSFWLVEALEHAGRHDEAHDTFENLCGLRGQSGLFAEEFDPVTGAHLGNRPQAFTHIGLINAALRLNHMTARLPDRVETA